MKCIVYFKKNTTFYDLSTSNSVFNYNITFFNNEIDLFDIHFENSYSLSLKYYNGFQRSFECPYYKIYNKTEIFLYIISIFLGSCEIISNNDNILNELANEYELKYGKLNYEGTNISSYFKDKLSVW